jgi:hypothetical protein
VPEEKKDEKKALNPPKKKSGFGAFLEFCMKPFTDEKKKPIEEEKKEEEEPY